MKNTVCQVLEYLTKIALSYGDLWGLAMETYGLWDRFDAGTGLTRHTCRVPRDPYSVQQTAEPRPTVALANATDGGSSAGIPAVYDG